jgi:hypothetical protein
MLLTRENFVNSGRAVTIFILIRLTRCQHCRMVASKNKLPAVGLP